MEKNKGKNKGHENLIPYKPGQCGNPKGRPKGKGIRYHMKQIAEEIDLKTGKTEGRLLAEALSKHARKGHSKAIDVIVDGVDGKLAQSLEVKGEIQVLSPEDVKKPGDAGRTDGE